MLSKALVDRLEADILPYISKPGRYTGNELNVIRKNHAQIDASIALAYPDIYDLGMSYYGFQILYHIINRSERLVAERVYAPWTDFEEELRRHNIPLFSLETKTPLGDFDVIGFTLQYELGYSNVLNMLDLAGIPLRTRDRRESDPFIVGGGSCAYNPEPMAAFMDFFLIGDAEESIVEILQYIAESRTRSVPRESILLGLSTQFSGVYVPQLYAADTDANGRLSQFSPRYEELPIPVQARRVSQLRDSYYPEKPLVPIIEISQDRLVLEIMRGCTQGCRFCQAGMIYRPVREREAASIIRQMQNSLPATGHEDASLLSLSTSDYTGLASVVMGTTDLRKDRRVSLSLPSLRLDSFTAEIASAVAETRKSGLTFAPEAGSQRLRDVLNKCITEEELITSVRIAVERGWHLIKLYFMIGLPTETMDDLAAIVDLTARLLEIGKPRLHLNITLSTFIPKPFTPFQWEAQDSAEMIQSKLDWIKPRLRRLKNVKVMARDPFVSQVEGILARGDRRTGDAIFEAWEKGAKFDAWREHFQHAIWKEVLERDGIADHDFLSTAQQALPWDIIDARVTRDFLWRERECARDAKTTRDCRNGCTACGVCDDTELMMRMQSSSVSEAVEKPVAAAIDTPPTVRYRLRYRKLPEMRFSGQLDILRLFQRALRRSGLPVRYSEGFNPRPKMSTGLPLPLGYTSDCEYLDISFNGPAKNIRERLNESLPEGIRVSRVEELQNSAKSLMKDLQNVEYSVRFLQELPADSSEKIRDLLHRREIFILRLSKRREKMLDIRPFIENICLQEAHEMMLQLQFINGQTAKVREILQELEWGQIPCLVHRREVHWEHTKILEQEL